ncbi:hypothetical protein [Candidatus Nitrosocosmicus hydrocola]|uniref:hypothetical protein n=1 Tax=Candidatus Nitrosocosmicus hydrocola TaxID=1826872 RepID=UPI0011E5D5D6|nr:hypothetical protein [Candidatus Nitrosocosmicus hydrocola]
MIASLFVVPIYVNPFDSIFAQSSNTLGQEGDGNEASQSESSSQSTNQNSMCVSGESTSLSCNDFSYQRTGDFDPNQQGQRSMIGKIYEVIGPSSQSTFSATSDASCSSGDSVISGGFKRGFVGDDFVNTDNELDSFMLDGDTWRVYMSDRGGVAELKVTAYAYCFDNP